MSKAVVPMTSGPIWKRMTYFALPLMLGNLFQQLYNTVDSLIVGNYLGSSALAAVSSSGSLIFLLIGFLAGVSSGAGVIVARYFGAGDRENLSAAVHTTIAFGLVASAVMTAVGMLLTPQILVWMGTPDSVMENSVTYLRIYFSGATGFIMYNFFVGILQAVGDGKHPLYYLMISSVVNFLLDVLFIGVLHTGVGGAALATVLSQLLSCLLCILELTRTQQPYRLYFSRLRFHLPILKQIVSIGLPSGVQNSIIAFANLVVQSDINSFGEMAMAGCGAYAKVEGFAFLPITSFNLAITTFVSQNLGASQLDRAKKGARFGILTSLVLAELIGVVIFTFAPQIISAFDSTPEVVTFGVEKSRASAPFFFLLAASHSIAAVLRGSGKATVPMIVMIVCWCLIRVTFLAITIPLTHSISMLYIVYPLTWGLSTVAFLVYYRKAQWTKK